MHYYYYFYYFELSNVKTKYTFVWIPILGQLSPAQTSPLFSLKHLYTCFSISFPYEDILHQDSCSLPLHHLKTAFLKWCISECQEHIVWHSWVKQWDNKSVFHVKLLYCHCFLWALLPSSFFLSVTCCMSATHTCLSLQWATPFQNEIFHLGR